MRLDEGLKRWHEFMPGWTKKVTRMENQVKPIRMALDEISPNHIRITFEQEKER
jgi:hypothetical protein